MWDISSSFKTAILTNEGNLEEVKEKLLKLYDNK